jgi:hypothetical protein
MAGPLSAWLQFWPMLRVMLLPLLLHQLLRLLHLLQLPPVQPCLLHPLLLHLTLEHLLRHLHLLQLVLLVLLQQQQLVLHCRCRQSTGRCR